ncbi:MAG: head GIN domain-containing protein [Chloroflexota bacterium]|nr:head GIN domain-containing protein [Chloroflexota bacterium]
MMRKRVLCVALLALVAAALLVTGCRGTYVTGSGNLETRQMDYDDFSKLEVSYAFDVDVTRGDSYEVSITMDDNLFDYLRVGVSGQTPEIGMRQTRWYRNATLRATVTMPDLTGLNVSGASHVEAIGFNSTDPLDMDVSGASSVEFDNVVAGDVGFDVSGASTVSGTIDFADGVMEVSGASTVELEGSADDVSIEASGASRVRLGDLPVTDAWVELSGASTANINASGTIDCDLSGASHLTYTGDATLGSVDTSGASTISHE